MENPLDPAIEIENLRARLAEAEETLDAIRRGEVDALVTAGPEGEQIFTLQGAETPYRILVEEMNQAALMLAQDATILYANSRFALFSKAPLEQVIGSSWQRFFPQQDRPRLGVSLETGQTGGASGQTNLLASDGSISPVHLSIRPTRHNGVAGFSVIITDLTERLQTEAILRNASAELLRKNEQLNAFSYSISHDMRAPLRAMKGFARILLDDHSGSLGPEPRSYLDLIIASADKLERLIRDVLADSQDIGSGDIAMFDLDQVVREMVQSYPNLREANIEVVPSSAPPVRGSAVALGQCISNLLANALKFVPADRVPCVKIWTEAARGGTRLCVQDNGIGIRLIDQERIFDNFTRVRGPEDFEGTGLGLNIVKKAVEKMGGRVGVESEFGCGSRFWIELQGA